MCDEKQVVWNFAGKYTNCSRIDWFKNIREIVSCVVIANHGPSNNFISITSSAPNQVATRHLNVNA